MSENIQKSSELESLPITDEAFAKNLVPGCLAETPQGKATA